MSTHADVNPSIAGHRASQAEVTELIYQYCHGLDRRELDRFMSIWAEDAVWEFDHPQIPAAVGREAIAGMVQMFWGGFPRMHHLSSNVLVSVEGDTGSAIWDAAAVFENQAGSTANLVASYTDEFHRVAGRWETVRRVVRLDPQIDLAG